MDKDANTGLRLYHICITKEEIRKHHTHQTLKTKILQIQKMIRHLDPENREITEVSSHSTTSSDS